MGMRKGAGEGNKLSVGHVAFKVHVKLAFFLIFLQSDVSGLTIADNLILQCTSQGFMRSLPQPSDRVNYLLLF